MGCCFSEPVDLDTDVDLFHFDLHRAVGKGAFGKVRVVEHKHTKQLYALKYIDKSRCIKRKAVANIIQERRLLEEIDHTYVVNMRYAFQSDENCFFVLDLMLGGDLRFHLDRMKKSIPEPYILFWIAQLSLALTYLHTHKIIHRDIKPDNILLDSRGHAHLTDFNVAIHYSERRLHTSVAGSLSYMAPQVVGRQGYSWQVDWWSLGVTAFELLCQKRPFEGRNAEKVTQAILNDPLVFPNDTSISEAGKRAVAQLVDRDPHKRLGCLPLELGIPDVRGHEWFEGIDWAKLENKDCQPPFVPNLAQVNFDLAHELDEFMMAEKPLTHSKRKTKTNNDINKLKPEMRQLEEQFTLYDFSKSVRNSYYPHNQPVVTTRSHQMTGTAATLQSATSTIVPTTTLEPSRSNSPIPPLAD